jgi:hypothetical protein
MPPSDRFESHPLDLTRPRAHLRDPFLRRHSTETLQLDIECFVGRVGMLCNCAHAVDCKTLVADCVKDLPAPW